MPHLVDNWTQPPPSLPPAVADALASAPPVERDAALWHGPQADGPMGGVTQSMLQNYLGCRERFRVKYVLGLRPADRWEKSSGYGSMWHVCEEALASEARHFGEVVGTTLWSDRLDEYTKQQFDKYPLQRTDIEHWWNVCCVQFPEYVKHWSTHPDVQDRTPLMQEACFDVPYKLPTGRTVRLRGKFDSVDLIPSQGGVFKQENKTKSDVDPVKLQRTLRFDLQTLTYRIALDRMKEMLHDKPLSEMTIAEQA